MFNVGKSGKNLQSSSPSPQNHPYTNHSRQRSINIKPRFKSSVKFKKIDCRFSDKKQLVDFTVVKELDEETNLYYYGARYLDPRTSRWIAGDPAIWQGDYIPAPGQSPDKLGGMGGLYNTFNFHAYGYAANNPIRYVDPDGREIDEETFRTMSAGRQYVYLKYQVEYGNTLEGEAKGTVASNLRNLRGAMNLNGLFNLSDEATNFMNIELRDFLNLNTDGTMNYRIEDLTRANGWEEMSSVGSMYHQTEAGRDLNAKFVHTDGREVVFDSSQNIVNIYPDKGTFNYINATAANSVGRGGHNLYDIIPFNNLMRAMNITIVTRHHGIHTGATWRGNRDYWSRR